MAKTSWIVKSNRPPKFSTRAYSRCKLCGRAGVYKKFSICRICLRNLANKGEIPGMRKSSW